MIYLLLKSEILAVLIMKVVLWKATQCSAVYATHTANSRSVVRYTLHTLLTVLSATLRLRTEQQTHRHHDITGVTYFL